MLLKIPGDDADRLLALRWSHAALEAGGVGAPDQCHLGRRPARISMQGMLTTEPIEYLVDGPPISIEGPRRLIDVSLTWNAIIAFDVLVRDP